MHLSTIAIALFVSLTAASPYFIIPTNAPSPSPSPSPTATATPDCNPEYCDNFDASLSLIPASYSLAVVPAHFTVVSVTYPAIPTSFSNTSTPTPSTSTPPSHIILTTRSASPSPYSNSTSAPASYPSDRAPKRGLPLLLHPHHFRSTTLTTITATVTVAAPAPTTTTTTPPTPTPTQEPKVTITCANGSVTHVPLSELGPDAAYAVSRRKNVKVPQAVVAEFCKTDGHKGDKNEKREDAIATVNQAVFEALHGEGSGMEKRSDTDMTSNPEALEWGVEESMSASEGKAELPSYCWRDPRACWKKTNPDRGVDGEGDKVERRTLNIWKVMWNAIGLEKDKSELWQ